MLDKSTKIVLGKGTEYEKEVVIVRPKGKLARKMMPKVLGVVAKMRELNVSEDNFDASMQLINTFWGVDEFENEILPYVLNLDTEEGRQYLDENCTLGEILSAFNEAAGFLLEETFGSPEVQEALGKSQEEALEAPMDTSVN